MALLKETEHLQIINQDKQLQDLLAYLAERSPFYKELFQKNVIDIKEIRSVSDLHLIPPTTKDDLQQRNDDFLCVPKEIVS